MRFAPVAFAVLFAVSAHAEPLPLRGPILPLTKLGLFQIYVMPPGGIADAASLSATQTFTGVNTFSQDAASTNTVLYPIINLRTSSGTAAIGMGVGIQPMLENASGTNKAVGGIEYVWTDPVNATEDVDLVFKAMNAGAAASEIMRLSRTAGSSITTTFSLIGSGGLSSIVPNDGFFLFSSRGGFSSTADGAINLIKNAGGATRAWLQQDGQERVTSDITNATTTFANITGLTANVISARKYAGRVVLRVDNSLAADGIKLDFNGGSATMTSFWAACHIDVGGAAVAVTQISTSLAGVINWSTITGDTYISCDVSFVPSSTSTFIMRQAGNAAVSGTLTTRTGTYWHLIDIP